MHQFYIILVSIILDVAYNVLNRKYFDNFSFINFIYVIKVYFILFLLIYFIKVYIIWFLITYLFYFLFFIHLLIILSYKTMKLKSIWNELWKCSELAWYHHFTHIACARKYRGLRQKLDALRVQNRQSPSKYQGFIRKLVCDKWISFSEVIWTP